MITIPKVLVVDDDDITRQLLRWSLEEAGYEVTEASDGAEALEILAQTRISIVISDLDMPRMDGLTLCKCIRSADFGGYIYVILLTSHSDISDRIAGLSNGADDYVSKPFNKTELIARVRCGSRVLQLETRQVLIFSLAKLAESRDNDTGLHLERVQNYANLLMARMAIDSAYSETVTPEFRRLLYETCPLHDIGKVGSSGDKDALLSQISPKDWNRYRIVAMGSVVQHYINDLLMSEVQDGETSKAATTGKIALQIHVGEPMTVQFKDIQLTKQP